MTTDHLQSLIADLDRLLSQTSSNISRSGANSGPHQSATSSGPQSTSDYWKQQEEIHQVLERVRAYLGTIAHKGQFSSELTASQEKLVEQITSAVVTQINHQLSGWFNSLETDLDELRLSRQSLLSNINLLQKQYQQIISDFMHLLMRRSQDVLQQQINQTTDSTAINSSEILEKLIRLQQQSDQLLTHLDSTFRSVFETLEQDLQGYSQSLSQGLARMHNLGEQGEAKLLAYINRLSEKLEEAPQIIPSSTDSLKSSPPSQPIEKIRLLTDLINLDHKQFSSKTTTDSPVVEQDREILQDDDQQKALSQIPEDLPLLNGWYLAIDFGSNSIVAVLSKINLETTEGKKIEEYPLSWSSGDAASFRLPTVAYPELENLKSLLNKNASLSEETWLILVSLFLTLSSKDIDSGSRIKVTSSPRQVADPNQLSEASLESALKELQGIIINIPTGWGENYRFHLREAFLAANLITDEQPIWFVEEAIATLLAYLPLEGLSSSPTHALVINSGATTTDLALVRVPHPIETLSYQDFLLSNLAYAGNSLEQDIFCQLIYPQWISQLDPAFAQLSSTIPQPGIPDPQRRQQLKQQLLTYPMGSSFIEAAKLAKLILQQQESFSSSLGNQSWILQRHDLEKIILRPFLQHLEEQINYLLAPKNLTPDDIGAVIVSGGTTKALWYALSSWIQEKFAQSVYFTEKESEIPTTVALGLARLPLFPHLVKTLR